MMKRKLRKLARSPGLFLRDYFNARYPLVRNEIGCIEPHESALIARELELELAAEPAFPIDVVYTWVDGDDPVWQAAFRASQTEPPAADLPGAGHNPARFKSHDELRYSLHSVLTFMPWVRHIHIVTADQRPAWLGAHPRIRLVSHRDLIDPAHLPTFNSHVIEAHLHRIPGLSEHFIYFNDDVIAARPLPPGHFFQPNGLAAHFVASKSLSAMHRNGRATPTLLASRNSQAVLHRLHDQCPDQPLVHSYIPLRKSACEELWSLCRDDILAFLPNRTRGASDLNLASFLAPWHAYFRGLSSRKTNVCWYFNVRSPAAAGNYQGLLQRSRAGTPPHSICLNDFRSDADVVAGYDSHLQAFLRSLFPDCHPTRSPDA